MIISGRARSGIARSTSSGGGAYRRGSRIPLRRKTAIGRHRLVLHVLVRSGAIPRGHPLPPLIPDGSSRTCLHLLDHVILKSLLPDRGGIRELTLRIGFIILMLRGQRAASHGGTGARGHDVLLDSTQELTLISRLL